MAAYYNEHDPFAAAWLRELIRAGLIVDGVVDERSIVDVRPGDLAGFDQCHFFAGIGGWSYALRLAGWPDDRPVWTGSCPCQPFSSAGQGRGKDDARHLWPQFRRLVRQCRPPVVFGEQVASKAGRAWLSAVFADLEALAYRAAGADLCGPSVGAFDIRQRLWFVADTERSRAGRGTSPLKIGDESQDGISRENRGAGRLADDDERGPLLECASRLHADVQSGDDVAGRGAAGGMGDGISAGLERHAGHVHHGHESGRLGADAPRSTAATGGAGFWADADWIYCRDEKWRPIEPGSFPLADGVPARVGRLRGYGNAIKPQVAAAFIKAYCEAIA